MRYGQSLLTTVRNGKMHNRLSAPSPCYSTVFSVVIRQQSFHYATILDPVCPLPAAGCRHALRPVTRPVLLYLSIGHGI